MEFTFADKDSDQPIAAVIFDGKPEYIWLDKKAPLGRKIRALEKTFPNYIVGLRSETSMVRKLSYQSGMIEIQVGFIHSIPLQTN